MNQVDISPLAEAAAEILKANPGYLDEGLDTAGASKFLGNVSEATLNTLRSRGGGPRFSKPLPNKVTYTRRWLIEWRRAGERVSTSDPGPLAAA